MTRRGRLRSGAPARAIDQRVVTLRRSVAVTGLVAVSGKPPRSRAVRTSEGDVPADLVIDAAGAPLSPIEPLVEEGRCRASVSCSGGMRCGRISAVTTGCAKTRAPAPLTTRIVEARRRVHCWHMGFGQRRSMQAVVAPLALDHRFKRLRYPEATVVLRSDSDVHRVARRARPHHGAVRWAVCATHATPDC